jgi:TPR repeat protein
VVLGELLSRGEGTQKDTAEAVRWWRAAANQGEPGAMLQLAARALEGLDPPRDEAWARQVLQLAASLGLDAAQFLAGEVLLEGLGGPVDRPGAAHWFSLAAAQGHKGAARRLDALGAK